MNLSSLASFAQQKLPQRDNPIWNWAMAVGLVGYLIAVGTPPTDWNYGQWLEFAFATVTALAGKGGWSFAPMKAKPK